MKFSFARSLLAFLALGLVQSLIPVECAADDTSPKVISFSSGPSSSNSVALTFDDGPHPKLTPQLLEILKAEDVTATFFMLGSMIEKYPDVARAVAAAGHEVANHSYSHERLPRLSKSEIHEEIVRTQALLEEATGTQAKLFRAPYGSTNGTVRSELLEKNLELVGWAVDPRDWERGKTSASITSFILKNTRAGDIILLHDIHSRSVGAVEDVIHGLKSQGFTFTTAGDLIAQKREEMVRLAEAADRMESTASSPTDLGPPSQPPVVPLGRSSLKRYNPATKTSVAPSP